MKRRIGGGWQGRGIVGGEKREEREDEESKTIFLKNYPVEQVISQQGHFHKTHLKVGTALK